MLQPEALPRTEQPPIFWSELVETVNNDVVGIAIGALVVLLVLSRQVQKRPVREDRGPQFMVILGIVGILEIALYLNGKPINGIAIGVLVGSLVVAAVFGVIRAYTIRLWREDGILYRQGNLLTVALWLIAIGVHFGLDLLIDRGGAGGALATNALVLYIAVTFGVQRAVVASRAGQLADTSF